MATCHAVGSADVKSLQARERHRGEDPCLAAVKEHSLNNCLVELCCDSGGSVFASKYLAHSEPCGSSLAYLGTDCLDVIVILGKEADT